MKATSSNIKLAASAADVETPRRAGLTFPDELKSYSTGPNVRLPVRFLRLNKEIAIWSAPLELFCEIAMEVRDKSKFKNTFYFGYTNGWLGYLLTPKELKLGGYEPRVSPYTAQAAADLTNAVLRQLNK